MAMKEASLKTASVAESMNKANKGQCSQALLIQAYCISVNQQPKVDFSLIQGEDLEKYQTDINEALEIAQAHSRRYLNVIQPAILVNIANIGNYYALHDAVATTLPEGSTEAEWIAALTTLATESSNYQTTALGIVSQLKSLSDEMNMDSANFRTIVIDLNARVEGDNGALADLDNNLKIIQKHIDGVITAVVISGLAIIGGIFAMVGGAVLMPEAPEVSTELFAGGFGVLAMGTGGAVVSAAILQALCDEKVEVFREESTLKAEVKLAGGISQSYASLTNQVAIAVMAATNMSNAWTSLSADLGSMIKDLENKIVSAGEIRTLFLAAANTAIKTVLSDIQIIKVQMSGVQYNIAKKGETVSEAIAAVVEGNQLQSERLTESPQSSAPSGALSQSLANLTVAENQIGSIKNLPASAQRIQEEALTIGFGHTRLHDPCPVLSAPFRERSGPGVAGPKGRRTHFRRLRLTNIPRLITRIQSLQSYVAKYVESALPQLDTIETMLANNVPLEEIRTAVDNLRKETDFLNTILDPVMLCIEETIETMYGYPDQLTSILAGIIKQRTVLQGQLGYAENREKTVEKKYCMLIALGPFGLAGLAAATAFYMSIKKEVNGYKSEISALNSQIDSLNIMITATGQLYTDLGNVTSSVASVKNAVSFVSNDILEIESDLSSEDARIVIAIKVKATITEVKTLAIDVS